jgi:hypothetical protein
MLPSFPLGIQSSKTAFSIWSLTVPFLDPSNDGSACSTLLYECYPFFLLEQKEAKIQERFKMVAAHRGLKAFSMRPALASQRTSKR